MSKLDCAQMSRPWIVRFRFRFGYPLMLGDGLKRASSVFDVLGEIPPLTRRGREASEAAGAPRARPARPLALQARGQSNETLLPGGPESLTGHQR